MRRLGTGLWAAVAAIGLTAGPVQAQSILERLLDRLQGGDAVAGLFVNLALNLVPPPQMPDDPWADLRPPPAAIDATVTNILRGADGSLARTDGGVAVTERLQARIGPIATTALGAVNTGAVTLGGVPASMAGDTARAAGAGMLAEQRSLEASATDATLLALNAASNAATVSAAVRNLVDGVDADIGRSGFTVTGSDAAAPDLATLDRSVLDGLAGGIRTTGIGSVNAGDIALQGGGHALTAASGTVEAGDTAARQISLALATTPAGAAADASAWAVNAAENVAGVNASVLNSISAAQVSIAASTSPDLSGTLDATQAKLAALTGSVQTTAIGAVNTGTILSGAGAAVEALLDSLTRFGGAPDL